MFIWETVDKKDLLVMSEHDKEYGFLTKFILHEVFVTGTVDKIHLLVISENEVELLTNVLPWTPFNFTTRNSKILKNRFIDRCGDRNRITIGSLINKRLLRAAQL